jgi:hypothetical protein
MHAGRKEHIPLCLLACKQENLCAGRSWGAQVSQVSLPSHYLCFYPYQIRLSGPDVNLAYFFSLARAKLGEGNPGKSRFSLKRTNLALGGGLGFTKPGEPFQSQESLYKVMTLWWVLFPLRF